MLIAVLFGCGVFVANNVLANPLFKKTRKFSESDGCSYKIARPHNPATLTTEDLRNALTFRGELDDKAIWILDLSDCVLLEELPCLISTYDYARFVDSQRIGLVDLRELILDGCSGMRMLSDLSPLQNLCDLSCKGCVNLVSLPRLPLLQELKLTRCSGLRCHLDLPESLEYLDLNGLMLTTQEYHDSPRHCVSIYNLPTMCPRLNRLVVLNTNFIRVVPYDLVVKAAAPFQTSFPLQLVLEGSSEAVPRFVLQIQNGCDSDDDMSENGGGAAPVDDLYADSRDNSVHNDDSNDDNVSDNDDQTGSASGDDDQVIDLGAISASGWSMVPCDYVDERKRIVVALFNQMQATENS